MRIDRIYLLAITAFCCLVSHPVLAQTQSQGDSRAYPAPWRPNFGPINPTPDANNSQPTGQAASAGTALQNRSQQDTSPPAAPQANQNNAARTTNPAGQNSNSGNRPVTPNVPSSNAANKSLGTNDDVGSNPASAEPANVKPRVTQVTSRLDKLPNSAGQIWREYDISPYTSRITNNEQPQQALLDWVLLETGTEMWFNQPLGILSADKDQLYVYHTPEIQSVVKKIVDRFVRTSGQLQKLNVNLMTVENPNWRALSYTMLQPIEVNSPGVEAWMVSKENAAILQSQLGRRGDAKQHSNGSLVNHDGQKFVLEKTRPVQFVRNLRWLPNQTPSYQPLMSNIKEGYTLEVGCLTSLDNNTIEATVKCDVDQVEKLSSVKVNLPGVAGSSQQMNLQIPQLVSWRLHERFRWPSDQVLLLSCGVVATPDASSQSGLRIPGFTGKSKRADALLFIEYRGPATGATIDRAASADRTPIRR